jgi:hypothetical protein
MLVFPSLGSQAEAAQNRPRDSGMSVEQHTLSGKAEEVNTFLKALRIFTVTPQSSGQCPVAGGQ